MADEDGDDHEKIILYRANRWVNDSISYEGYDKHVEEIANYFGLGTESKGLNMLIVKETKEEAVEESPPLSTEMLTEFRGLAARAN